MTNIYAYIIIFFSHVLEFSALRIKKLYKWSKNHQEGAKEKQAHTVLSNFSQKDGKGIYTKDQKKFQPGKKFVKNSSVEEFKEIEGKARSSSMTRRL